MNRKQYLAAIAAAEAELARLQAIVPDPEEPLMVLSAERVPRGSSYYIVLGTGRVTAAVDYYSELDRVTYEAASYYSSEEQAEAYARAFRTLRLIRRQPGIVANCSTALLYTYIVTIDGAVAVHQITGCHSSSCMFPCFNSRDAAHLASDAVGVEELAFCANFLAGNISA